MVLSGWESVFFWVFALAALVAGLLTVMARNAVHSALFLISALVSVAALFVLLGAEFIAGVQILVYVGGVMVLFLFVIMLVNVGAEEREQELLFNRTGQVVSAVCFIALLILGLYYAINQSAGRFSPQPDDGPVVSRADAEAARMRPAATNVSKISEDTQRVGSSLYRYGALPFEIASLLLLVAIVGSVLLARTSKQELAHDDAGARAVAEPSAAGGLSPAEVEEASRAQAFEV